MYPEEEVSTWAFEGPQMQSPKLPFFALLCVTGGIFTKLLKF